MAVLLAKVTHFCSDSDHCQVTITVVSGSLAVKRTPTIHHLLVGDSDTGELSMISDNNTYSIVQHGVNIYKISARIAKRETLPMIPLTTRLFSHWSKPLKVHKHEIILNFFYLNQILICPW